MARHPRYAPDYRIEVAGKPLPKAVRGAVTSVRFQEGLQESDRVEVALANPDLRWLQEHIRGLGFQPFPTGIRIGPTRVTPSDGLFDVDNKLTLALGYGPGALDQMFEGEITGVQASFPSGGVPGMTIVAHDYLHRLTVGTHARGFGPLPDALIARILSIENFLLPLIDPAVDVASTALAVVNNIFSGSGRKQKAQSDFELLQELAAAYDADFWVEGDVLFVARLLPKEYSPRLTLRWGESLMDFSPSVNTVGQVAAAAMKFTLRELKVSFLVTVFWDFDREAAGITVEPGEAVAGAKKRDKPAYTIVDQPIASPGDIATSALTIYHELRRRLNNRLTATGSCVGDPRVRAGAIVRFDGLGPDFSGDYRITSATHTIDTGGYRTSFKARREILP